MSIWNGDPRAVVPPDHLRDTRDVIVPTRRDASASPYPLGLGVYALRNASSKRRRDKLPLPLFYVSEVVSMDRSPVRDYRNGAGVRPGWYVIARPSVPFEVRITLVNKRAVGAVPFEDCYTTMLDVDGVSTNGSKVFSNVAVEGVELTEDGFVEGVVGGGGRSFGFQSRLRPFFFQKANANDEGKGSGSCDAGSIKLNVEIGQTTLRTTETMTTEQYELKGQDVSEKVMAKEGKSLSVKRDGHVVEKKERLCKYVSVHTRALPEANVEIFVREASWMRSRRLIDDDGNPCTYGKYRELLHKDNSPGEHDKGINSDDKARVRKRAKIQPQVADVRESQARDVVDLT